MSTDKKKSSKYSDIVATLKKLWSPIAGFAGAVTFVVQVIQLWKGDQATVTMVAAGLGAALVFVYLILVTFSKRKDETKKDILKT